MSYAYLHFCQLHQRSCGVQYGLHRRWPRSVCVTRFMNPICICDIDDFLIRAEADPIGPSKPICHCSDAFHLRVVTVDLIRKIWLRSITLMITIHWISEPDATIIVDHYIIDGIEWSSVETRNQKFVYIWWGRRHVI